MPVYSMTGYASAQQNLAAASPDGNLIQPGAVRLGLEIRAVNSRFLDLSFKLPEDLRQYEPALRELLQSRLKRGKVELRAFFDQGSTSSVQEPQTRQLQRFNAMQDSIRAWLPEARPLSVADVIRLAGQEQSTTQDWSKVVMPLAEKTVKELTRARQSEGARLAEMIKERIVQLRTLGNQAVPLVPMLVAQQRQKFMERWAEALGTDKGNGAISAEAARDRALTEATSFAIRIDVAEEISRLQSHLDELDHQLGKGGEIGKRMDFLIQELHREANTLGSKSAALELTRIAVDMKVAIEQMREQVQNIE